MKKYDRYLTRGYLVGACRRALEDKALRPRILSWIADTEEELAALDAGFLSTRLRELGLDGTDEDGLGFGARRRGQRRRTHSTRASGAPHAKDYLSWAIERLQRSIRQSPPEGAEARATALAVRRFALGKVCGPVLELARLYDMRMSPVEQLWDTVKEGVGDHLEATAVLLGVSPGAVERALRQLSGTGIADPETWGRNGAEPDDYVSGWFERVYRPPVANEQELRKRLVPLAPEPLLDLGAFDHLDGGKEALRLFSAAVARGEGVRLLFYGRAGTGKTEFSKTLARAAGARLYDLCEPESGGVWREESDSRRMDRSADKRNRVRMAASLLRSEPGAALLIDEVEDVLSSERGSRRENHELLEQSPVPVIFTGNQLSEFDEALLRRFDLTIRFKAQSPTRRRAVVLRMLESSGVESLAGEALEPLAFRLADELECPPGIIERAIHSTRLMQGSPDDLFRLAERHERTISTHICRPRVGAPVPANLSWEAFVHLAEGAEYVRRLFTAALRARRDGRREGRGITFLAYGPPGCGKTEFCRTLAAEAGATLYSVGGKEQGPESRLPVPRRVSLEYAIEALTDEPEAVILFDEIEDFVFGEKKHWLNGLVENTPVPLLFTANAIKGLRRFLPHFLDRLTYSLEFRDLPRERRATMFADQLGVGRSAEMTSLAEELARDRRVTPRQVWNAEVVADLSGGGAEAARRAVLEKAKLLRGKGTAESKAAEKYDFSLVHSDPDLAALTDRIGKIGRCRMGILLDGPSGSGKSEYAKQLAKRMGLDPLTKRASELMSKWVGKTEQRIAKAFAEARATDSFLIIDEADSFLADRRDAHHNWETSMVNEMLSQLETHDLPYAFTTNLADRLDPAVARRFLFRATFKFLDEARVVGAWDFFFSGECPTHVRTLTRLVPADFALVHERAEKLGYLDDPEQIASELVDQSRDKNRAGTVGF